MKTDVQQPDSDSMAPGEWRRGWGVVLSAAVGYGTGGGMILLLAGLFIKPMREDLGWSTSAVTIAPIFTFVWAFCYPFAGAVIDRLGSRRVAIFGAVGLALCAALLAIVPVSRFTLYGIAALAGVFCSLTAVPTYTRAVAGWFRSGVGLAFGLTLSGSALVAILATPLTGTAIATYGWRAGYLAIAVIILCIGVPALLLGFKDRRLAGQSREDEPRGKGEAIGEALRDVRFWLYLLAFTVACVPLGGFVGHLQPLLADKGFPLPQALSLGVLYAVSMTFGKVVGGILLDRIWPFAVAAAITAAAGVGAFNLAYADSTLAMPVIALMTGAIGMAQGAEADFIAYFVLRTFGMRAFATIVGVLGLTANLGLALGGFSYGMLFDMYADYRVASLIGAACLWVSGGTLLLAGVSAPKGVRRS